MKHPATLLLFILVCSGSCRKSSANRYQKEIAAMWDCHHRQAWDSVSIATALAGNWEWIATVSFWSGSGEVTEKVFASFSSDSTLRLSVDGQMSEHRWHVVRTDYPEWGVEISPAPLYFYGRIQFCEDRVLFNHSYIDGSDNLFRRVP